MKSHSNRKIAAALFLIPISLGLFSAVEVRAMSTEVKTDHSAVGSTATLMNLTSSSAQGRATLVSVEHGRTTILTAQIGTPNLPSGTKLLLSTSLSAGTATFVDLSTVSNEFRVTGTTCSGGAYGAGTVTGTGGAYGSLNTYNGSVEFHCTGDIGYAGDIFGATVTADNGSADMASQCDAGSTRTVRMYNNPTYAYNGLTQRSTTGSCVF